VIFFLNEKISLTPATAHQPLANLIFYLLEPRLDDGLVTWTFFDEYLEKKGINEGTVEFPVFKYW